MVELERRLNIHTERAGTLDDVQDLLGLGLDETLLLGQVGAHSVDAFDLGCRGDIVQRDIGGQRGRLGRLV